MQGVFLDIDTVDHGDLDFQPLRSTLSQWTTFPDTSPAELGRRIENAEVVVSNKVMLDSKALQAAGKLGLVCIAATGTNNIDLQAARDRNITVCNVSGYATPSVVEHVFALLLILSRRLDDYRHAVRQGLWQSATGFCLLDYPIRELAGLTLGIIGYGELGRAVATAGKAFGMIIRVAERRGRPPRPGRITLEELLKTADVVSLHCPLTDETRNLIGARELDQMHTDSILINTARGGIVDETALLHALQAGRIGGAALDVLHEEPPRHGNPLLEVNLPSLLVTPHIAWASTGARQRLINGIAENIRAWRDGIPRNVVSG